MSDSSDRVAALAASAQVPATPLDLATQTLLRDRQLGSRVELVAPGLVGLRTARGRVVLLEDRADEPERVTRHLQRIRQRDFPARHVVVLGGGRALRERLRAEPSDRARSGLWVHHTDGREPTWQSREPGWLERRLTRALAAAGSSAFQRRSWSMGEAEAQARRLELDRMLSRDEARDFERFRMHLSRRRPRATVALVAVILVVFALQASWGGMDLPPLLASMGSLVPERARSGQWWRFFSCTFLHGGPLHVGLNVLVLWMLGRSLERFIGTTRFLLIYFSAGVAGSVASSLFVDSQSVGASGAIWGLLGAEAALAFYPRPLLPPALVSLARRTAAANLALNLINSFNPHVDAAAHIGGGLMGAAVLVLLAMTGRLSPRGRAAPPVGWLLRAFTAGLAGLFLAGLVVAQVAGRPWQLDRFPALERVALAGSPWSVEVPRGLSLQASSPATSEQEAAAEFGELAFDPSVVDFTWLPLLGPDSMPAPAAELSALVRLYARPPAGLEVLIPPHVVPDAGMRGGGHVAVRYRYTANVEVIEDTAIGIFDAARVRVRVVGWAALPRAFEGLAPRILRSLEAPAEQQ